MTQLNNLSDLRVDDILVVPTFGLCRIIRIEKCTRYEHRDTYVTFTAYGSDVTGTITIPFTKFPTQGVRWPVNPGRMLEVLEHLCDARRKISRNPHTRERHFRQQLSHTDPQELAECVRDLWVPEDSERSYLNIDIYEQALDRLAREVAFVFNEPKQGVRGKLESIIANRQPPEELFGSNAKAVSEQ